MFNLYEPDAGDTGRISLLATSPGSVESKHVTACFHPDIGFFHTAPDVLKFSMPSQDPQNEGVAVEYTALLVAVWPTDTRGHVHKGRLHGVQVEVWLLPPWDFKDFGGVFRDFNLHEHDVVFRDFNLHEHDVGIHYAVRYPWPRPRIIPCRGSVARKIRDKRDTNQVETAIQAYLDASEAAWEQFVPMDLIPKYSHQQIETCLGLKKAHKAVRDAKWEAELAKRVAKEVVDPDPIVDDPLADLINEDSFPDPLRRLRLEMTLADLQAEPDLALKIYQILHKQVH